MNTVERWIRQNFDVVEVDSVTYIYSGEGPPGWYHAQPELERNLDPGKPGDWWRMVCLMELCNTLTSEMHVLDIGCGLGWPTIPLATYVKEIVAVDASELSISLIKRNIKRRGIRNVKVGYADATNLPFDTMSFDAVIASDVMDTLSTPYDAASEMFRVLKPGGRIVSWVQNFCFVLGERSGRWSRSMVLETDTLVYTCHFATTDPPHSIEFCFRGDARHSVVNELDLSGDATSDSILSELTKLRPALNTRVEFYRTHEYVPETAADPFAAAGFTDLTVSPLNVELCVEFATELDKRGALPDTSEAFRATASALLKVMRYADFSRSAEISVKGKRPCNTSDEESRRSPETKDSFGG